MLKAEGPGPQAIIECVTVSTRPYHSTAQPMRRPSSFRLSPSAVRIPIFPFVVLVLLLTSGAARSMDQIVLKREGQEIHAEGRLLVQAKDGGVALLGRDGVIWIAEAKDLIQQTHDDPPFAPYDAKSLAPRVLAELPRGFAYLTRPHYVVCYNTSREYAQWCGSLFEALYKAFETFWKNQGFKLSEPEFPLVAVVFADQRSYSAYAAPDLGGAAASIIGYYSLRSNRMTAYDLTGTEALSQFHKRRGSMAAEINQILSHPEGERTAATIVHEATHQIAFNCGLHNRFSDCPRWFSEGIAMYFETLDLRYSRGWGTIGNVNRVRLGDFHTYLRRRPADSLRTLLTDDRRFSDAEKSIDAYAEAWTLTYFLLRQHRKQYVEYLKTLCAKPVMIWDTPEKRLQEFTQAFGDLKKLDTEFVRYVQRTL